MTDASTAAVLANNFDFSDPAVRVDPPAVWAELHKGPPRWTDAYGGHWVVSRYDDLKEVLATSRYSAPYTGPTCPPTDFHTHYRRIKWTHLSTRSGAS
jgi:cytochrome P450